MWNIVLNTVIDDKLVSSENNPKKSGNYVCTCVQFHNGKEINRYLQVMAFDSSRKIWHDNAKPSSISHIILAWTELSVCDFKDFRYLSGGYLVPLDYEDSAIINS